MPQVRTDHSNVSQFAPAANVIVEKGHTVAQDAARGTADMVDFTVMAFSSGELIPLTDNTAVDGTQFPVGLLKGTIAAADIVAGDVTNQRLYKSGRYFAETQIVLENSVTLDDSITVSTDTGHTMTIRHYLETIGIFIQPVEAVAGYENS